MEWSPPLCDLLKPTADSFTGPGRRRFLADTVTRLARSQRHAQRLFGWSRDTIRKALHELHPGITCTATSGRGRKPAEQHRPRLVDDLRARVRDHCQPDPTFQTTRRYCRLTAAQVPQQLSARKGYTAAQLPCPKTIGGKRNALGCRLRQVAKGRPPKK